MGVEKLIETLRKIVEKYPEIKLMYLFGSYAENRAMPISDIDIAVIATRRSVIPHLVADIAKELGIAEEKISILDLEYASPVLILTVLKRGIKIVDRDNETQKLVSKIEPEILELNELREIHFVKWVEENPLDFRVIERIVSQIQEDIEDLRCYLARGLEVILSDRTLRKAFERTLHTAIEGCIDLLRHLVSGLGLGVAEYYRDYVEICRRRGVISNEIAEKLLELIPVRHMLVHRYRELDYTKLWRDAQTIIEVAPKLIEEVRRYLRTLKETGST